MSSFEMRDDPECNPYASPQADGSEPTRYYRFVYSGLTYGECWRLAPSVLSFLVTVVYKALGIDPQFQMAVVYPDRLDLVDFDEIPAHVLKRWQPALDACPDLGLRMKLCQRMPTLGNAEAFSMVLVRDDGQWVVSLTYERVLWRGREQTSVTGSIASLLQDDRRR